MRQSLLASFHNIPLVLREIFELFVESNSKKGYLVTRKLLTSQQRDLISQSVLDCCSMCGPDPIDEELLKLGGSAKQNK